MVNVCMGSKWATHGIRAVQLIEFDSHAHLVSKAGSVIGAKSPSPVSNAAAVNTQSHSSLTSYAISRS